MGQISSANPIDTFRRAEPTNQFSAMSSEDFLSIMFTELSNQDPFSPNDSAALLEQLNSIRSIESDIAIQKKLERMVTENQLASGANLLGTFVGGLTADYERVAGTVVSVLRQGDQISLELDSGFVVPFENIETIFDIRTTPAPGGPSTPGTPPAPGGTPPVDGDEPPIDIEDPGDGTPIDDPPSGGGDPIVKNEDPTVPNAVTPQPPLTPRAPEGYDPSLFVKQPAAAQALPEIVTRDALSQLGSTIGRRSFR
ncbi:MAG: hypothetical protein KDA25_02650 [Phycisphaerales bacterium]|nr:hypothetical protein [Phycisphaerales bacterium]